jgi:hypothetical protein
MEKSKVTSLNQLVKSREYSIFNNKNQHTQFGTFENFEVDGNILKLHFKPPQTTFGRVGNLFGVNQSSFTENITFENGITLDKNGNVNDVDKNGNVNDDVKIPDTFEKALYYTTPTSIYPGYITLEIAKITDLTIDNNIIYYVHQVSGKTDATLTSLGLYKGYTTPKGSPKSRIEFEFKSYDTDSESSKVWVKDQKTVIYINNTHEYVRLSTNYQFYRNIDKDMYNFRDAENYDYYLMKEQEFEWAKIVKEKGELDSLVPLGKYKGTKDLETHAIEIITKKPEAIKETKETEETEETEETKAIKEPQKKQINIIQFETHNYIVCSPDIDSAVCKVNLQTNAFIYVKSDSYGMPKSKPKSTPKSTPDDTPKKGGGKKSRKSRRHKRSSRTRRNRRKPR